MRGARAIDIDVWSDTLGPARIADELADVSAARLRSVQQSSDDAAAALSAVLDALDRVRHESSTAAVLDIAPRQLCASGPFDRVMLSAVRGSLWSPQALYVRADGYVNLQIDEAIEGLEIPLASPLVEAEVVRRRVPALVNDAMDEPRTYAPLVEWTGCRDYVVAPLIAMSTVVGLLHADRHAGSPVGALDRDLLRMYADGVGVAYERAVLSDRADQQRRTVAEVCDAAVRVLAELDDPPSVALDAAPRPLPSRAVSPSAWDRGEVRESNRLSRLTAREREVLALLAHGATNAQLADQLTVAESTVKSHVKHILHKLGAGNRAAAIACYLREARTDERRPR
ncbi:DNA-binding CsgD family transcriptional regulator [Mycolicibacterium sp. BK556]|uniref:LuxR C-terminal-related transcriptional regulator n=1 Tax=unclassified Mycolicibacterium TaxID=2636767 RepID=UPI001622149A|nr:MULTISPECIES: LuxR C-terminal-related transcriptional regulator [unclassified Mycolicibacterium]MBB3605962.1 DNA-binding CsgD family transcriptional regulator [Mycolicibacterium sp. BK556]MBB3632539.1 DNA-binding CsgD family transcriptional regulator [Mycolicibacterium sp. BK607]